MAVARVLIVWMWLLVSLAWASETPFRCDAVWLEPSKKCPLEITAAATGTGSDERSAKEASLSRLAELIASAAELQEIQFSARSMDAERCAEDAKKMGRVSCAPAIELLAKKTCFVEFSNPACVGVDAFELVGPGWKMMEKGRERICAAVERAHRTAAPIIQHKCMASCLEEALVRCP
jgi:hypothetical protein